MANNNRNFGIFDPQDDFFSNFGKAFLGSVNNGSFDVDIVENDNDFVVSAELPGFKKKGINISYQDDNLTIKAQHESSSEVHNDDGRVIRHERSNQNVSRSFYLPSVNAEMIKASYDGGVLTITLPKKDPETTGVHRIEID